MGVRSGVGENICQQDLEVVEGRTEVVGGGKFSARFCSGSFFPLTKNKTPPPTTTAKIMKKRMAFRGVMILLYSFGERDKSERSGWRFLFA